MDLDKSINQIEKRKEINRRYYMRKHGLVELTDEQKQLQLIERARKRHEAYERQKAHQRQMRHERGLKPLGRPIKIMTHVGGIAPSDDGGVDDK